MSLFVFFGSFRSPVYPIDSYDSNLSRDWSAYNPDFTTVGSATAKNVAGSTGVAGQSRFEPARQNYLSDILRGYVFIRHLLKSVSGELQCRGLSKLLDPANRDAGSSPHH